MAAISNAGTTPCISQAELLLVQEGSCKHPYQQAGVLTLEPA